MHDGSVHDGSVHELSAPLLLVPLERALSSLSWAMVALTLALVAARGLLTRAVPDETAAKPVDSGIHNAIVTPPQQPGGDPRGQSHR